jgi:hypothetical protein
MEMCHPCPQPASTGCKCCILSTFFLEISAVTATTTTGTHNNGQTRKTLASQLDRLDGILDGLDAALAGAVQEAVEQAVKQAVQAVLNEVLSNRQLQEQLQQAAPPATLPEERPSKQSLANRLWQSTAQSVRRMARTVKKVGHRAGMALVAAGAVVAGMVYAARKKIALVASSMYRHGKQMVHGVLSYAASFLPTFAFGG